MLFGMFVLHIPRCNGVAYLVWHVMVIYKNVTRLPDNKFSGLPPTEVVLHIIEVLLYILPTNIVAGPRGLGRITFNIGLTN